MKLRALTRCLFHHANENPRAQAPINLDTLLVEPVDLAFDRADLSAGPESPLLAAAGTKDPITAYEIVAALAGNASNPNARDHHAARGMRIAVTEVLTICGQNV